MAAVINDGTDGSPVGTYVDDDPNKSLPCDHVVIHADPVVAAFIDHKGVIPVSRVLRNDPGSHLWKITVFAVERIKLLKILQLGLILDQLVVFTDQAFNLQFQIFVFLDQLPFVLKYLDRPVQLTADAFDAVLEGNYDHPGCILKTIRSDPGSEGPDDAHQAEQCHYDKQMLAFNIDPELDFSFHIFLCMIFTVSVP